MAGAEHERTLRSERGFDGRLVHVRVDHVRLPSGRESVREVVEHPGAVAIAALTSDDQVILVRQWRHAVGEQLLEIPAGTREPGEPAAETARRELIEETGYSPSTLTEIASVYSSAGYCTEQVTIFVAKDCTSIERSDDPDEGTEIVLIPRHEIGRLIEPGTEHIRDAKTLIGLLFLTTQR
jgi:ADP-ribose pyrophosphatase